MRSLFAIPSIARPGRPLRIVLAVGAFFLAASSAQQASAYPQWQFSSGVSRCNVCHFSPSGGGLINGYGRDAAGEDLSTWTGEGAFLHGMLPLPSWLAIGGDLRGAYAAQDVGDIHGSKHSFFPMQADLQVRVRLAEAFSVYASGGLRGQVRPNQDLVPLQNYQALPASRLISREHWLLWQPASQGWYLRAGRFFAPFGLRLAEHLTYVRRDLGFDMLEESYNLSGGFLSAAWELHLTAFAPDFVRHVGSEEYGGAAYYEHRTGDQKGSLAVQARFARGNGISKFIGGTIGRYYVELAQTLFFLEANLVHLMPDDVSGGQQFVGLAGASVLPVRGWVMTVLGERSQSDLRVRNAAWNAYSGLVSWFPGPTQRDPAGGPAAAARRGSGGQDPAPAGALLPVREARWAELDEVDGCTCCPPWRRRAAVKVHRLCRYTRPGRTSPPFSRGNATTATGPPPAPPGVWVRQCTDLISST